MNWLHDEVLANGLWSPHDKAARVIAPALAELPSAVVIDASSVVRWWFDRENPLFRWDRDVITHRPTARSLFLEARAPRRVRVDGAWSNRWPWPCRRFGVLLVSRDLRAIAPDPVERAAFGLTAIRTIESWGADGEHATELLDDPRWGLAMYVVGDRGAGPALIGAGAMLLRDDGSVGGCATDDIEAGWEASRLVTLPARDPATAEDVRVAGEELTALLTPLLVAHSLLWLDNEPDALITTPIAPPSRAEALVPGPAPSRHLVMTLAGLPAWLAAAGGDRPNGVAGALRRRQERFVRTSLDERQAA